MSQRDPSLDYTTEHTAADPSNVRRETVVDNDDKVLPTDDNNVTITSAIATVVAVIGLILCFALDWDVAGTVVALTAVIAAGIGLVMAIGDERAGNVLPAVTTIVVSILFLVCLFDMFGAEDAVRDLQDNRIGVVDPDTSSEALDGDADLGNVND